MKTADRDLPKNIYHSGQSGFIAVVRHNGVRHQLGSFSTLKAAQARIDMFREENPYRTQNWQPGDVVR
jgi:hypothetical protein